MSRPKHHAGWSYDYINIQCQYYYYTNEGHPLTVAPEGMPDSYTMLLIWSPSASSSRGQRLVAQLFTYIITAAPDQLIIRILQH